jgi:phospholipid/cholesterol/gamma-HCH transport system ATP-binding protein
MDEMLACDHPWLQAYFHGVRGSRLTGALRRPRDETPSGETKQDKIEKDEIWKPAPITP